VKEMAYTPTKRQLELINNLPIKMKGEPIELSVNWQERERIPKRIFGLGFQGEGLFPTCGPRPTNEELVKTFLDENKDLFFIKDPEKELMIRRSIHKGKDSRLRVGQYYQNCRVRGAVFHFRFDDDTMMGLESSYIPNLKLGIKENLNFEEAMRIALAHDKSNREFKNAKGERVILNLLAGAKAAWRVRIKGNAKDENGCSPAIWDYYIDLNDGKMIGRENRVRSQTRSDVSGRSYYLSPNDEQFKSYGILKDGKYYLKDVTKSDSTYPDFFIETRKAADSNPCEDDCAVSVDSNGTWLGSRQKIEFDCHLNCREVYDYFFTRFGRKGYDDKGSPLIAVAHYGVGTESGYNSWCLGSDDGNEKYFVGIGDGDGIINGPLCSRDKLAHEWTHAFLEYELMDNERKLETDGDTTYESKKWREIFESGALQEALCDSFAAFMTEEWRIGRVHLLDTSKRKETRDLSCPSHGKPVKAATIDEAEDCYFSGHLPDHMDYYYEGEWDNHGEHLNSTIVGKATYLMATGKSHGPSAERQVDCGPGMGVRTLEQIYYRAVTNNLLPTCDFKDFADNILVAIQELFSIELDSMNEMDRTASRPWVEFYRRTAIRAFKAVGIYDMDVQDPSKPTTTPKWSFLTAKI
jgi:Zn-dependent metalloprotease